MQPSAVLSPPECPSADAMQAFAEGRAPVGGRASLELHLQGCSECRAVLALLGGGFEDDTPALPVVEERGPSFGRYVLKRQLGAGGMGRVFLAYDPHLSRDVALKLVRTGEVRRAELQRRLLREAQAMAKVRHPAVVMVLDVGAHRDDLFIAMELVDGVTLTQWLHGEPDVERVLSVFAQAAQGLAAAHRANLVHRDFKPDNVMVTRDGQARVTDFGLACSGPEPLRTPFRFDDEAAETDDDLTELTNTGAMMGTPRYMAPEQFMGEAATPLADQFAFFVALHEALWGVSPFAGRSRPERKSAVLAGRRAVRPVREVPAWLQAAVERGLSVDPKARFSSMDEVAALLSRDVRAERARVVARRRALGAGVVAGAVAVALASTSAGGALDDRLQGLALAHAAQPWPDDVVLVAEDQQTVDALGWPPERSELARVVNAVHAAGAKAIVWDGFFHLPGRDGPRGDEALARALQEAGAVLAVPCTVGGGAAWAPPGAWPLGVTPALECARMLPPTGPLAATRVGHVEAVRSPTGAVRGTYALASVEGRGVPALGLAAWLRAEGHAVVAQGPRGLDTTGGFIPTDAEGGMRVSHRLPWDDAVVSLATLAGHDVLPEALAARLRGKYVLVGQTAETLHDTAPFADGARLPMVLLHGMLLADLLEGRRVRDVPRAVGVVLALLFGLLAAAAAARLEPRVALLGALALGCGAWGGTLTLAREGWVASPLAALGAVVAAFAAASLMRRR